MIKIKAKKRVKRKVVKRKITKKVKKPAVVKQYKIYNYHGKSLRVAPGSWKYYDRFADEKALYPSCPYCYHDVKVDMYVGSDDMECSELDDNFQYITKKKCDFCKHEFIFEFDLR